LFTQSPIENQASGGNFRNFLRTLLQRSLRYVRQEKKCFISAAVILFVFLGVNYSQNSSKNFLGIKSKVQDIENLVEESAGFTQSILGGVSSGLSAAIMPAAQANIDFSADDAEENYQLDILDGSGVVSQNSPSGGDFFSGLRRETTVYAVESGDTISSIGVKFGISSDTILWANNLGERDIIRPGQKLSILPINGVQVKVAKKDTVVSLAKKYKGKTDEILAFNSLAGDKDLIIGKYIIIPDGEMTSVSSSASKVSAPKYVQGAVSTGGWLIVPTSGHNWGRLHNYNAVDISSACGTPIYAAAGGIISLADSVGWNSGYGKYIIIKHSNGVSTLYGHTSQIVIGVGEQVEQGQLIALMGTTGRSSGCHLHFEVRGAKNPLIR